jgi:hypothetical protein
LKANAMNELRINFSISAFIGNYSWETEFLWVAV